MTNPAVGPSADPLVYGDPEDVEGPQPIPGLPEVVRVGLPGGCGLELWNHYGHDEAVVALLDGDDRAVEGVRPGRDAVVRLYEALDAAGAGEVV